MPRRLRGGRRTLWRLIAFQPVGEGVQQRWDVIPQHQAYQLHLVVLRGDARFPRAEDLVLALP